MVLVFTILEAFLEVAVWMGGFKTVGGVMLVFTILKAFLEASVLRRGGEGVRRQVALYWWHNFGGVS